MEERSIKGRGEQKTILEEAKEMGIMRKREKVKDFCLFLFNVLSSEHMLRSSRSEKGQQYCLPFSDDPGSTWKLPYGGTALQGNMRIWTDVHVLLNLIYSFFTRYIF